MQTRNALTALVLVAVCAISVAAQSGQQSAPAKRPAPRHDSENYDVAEMFKMHANSVSKEFTTGAQPTPEILKEFRDKGTKAVINLRPRQEHNAAEEEEAAKRLGLRYYNIPVVYRDPKFEQVDEFLKLTDDPANRPALIHCTMNIRAGAFFAIRRVLRDGWTWEDAEKEAAKGAPIAAHLKRLALDYIAARQKK
jgi:uncharacterized protein (TIGR01244 family)